MMLQRGQRHLKNILLLLYKNTDEIHLVSVGSETTAAAVKPLKICGSV